MRLEKNIQFTGGAIQLPTSKSLSNRALIIRELCDPFKIYDLSDSDDTQNLISNLNNDSEIIDVGAAGTNMRFLISLLSVKGKQKTITGTERMLKRPIGKLVDALNSLGANVDYAGERGFPPIIVNSQVPIGGNITIDGSESSQFVSSLLMIAPKLKNGVYMKIVNERVSSSYIQMTIDLMKYFGVVCETMDDSIRVVPQNYVPKDYTVEGDWSAAGFWYGLIATSGSGTFLQLENLRLDSLQGDKKTAEYFNLLGIETTKTSNGIKIEKKNPAKNDLYFDLINEPDLFPALAFACATLKIKSEFTGLQTLNLKESKRVDVIAVELKKTGAICEFSNDHLRITGYQEPQENINFDSHDDHRIAMASSIYLMSGHPVTIENTNVVSKSYPSYWEHLKNIRIANIY